MEFKSSRHRQSAQSSTGIVRDDSDDELGAEDHPWEWLSDPIDEAPSMRNALSTRKRTRLHSNARVIGARMGDFECRVGDCVLLKAEGSKEAWVAIICEFIDDDDGEKAAKFMWFATEKEIRNTKKKRQDFLPNELYISPSWDINPLAAINGKATIHSQQEFIRAYPSGRVPRSSPEYGKVFVCRRGCNIRTATYSDEFEWEDLYRSGEQGAQKLIAFAKSQIRSTRKRHLARESSSPELSYTINDGKTEAWTPRATVARRTSDGPADTTPSSRKRVMVKKSLEFTPLGTRKLSASRSQSSAFQLARSQLHVASVPSSLPCRENEFTLVYSHLEAAIADGIGSCIYIAGTPGTGKTATVREVISRLEDCVQSDELDDFIFVEINGMKITDPHQSYSLLWEALKGERVSPSQAIDLLEREFTNPSPRRTPCVVLMDELDQLVTRNQSVMYNFFNWPGLRHSRLIVLAVANTMDLPERTLSNKISSRIGLTRITFPGYNHEQLMKIIQSRLEGVPGSIVEPDAVQFASRKVAAVSGDARRVLEICRRAVELAEADSRSETAADNDQSKHHESSKAGKAGTTAKVSISTIKRAINEATTNPIQQHLRTLAFTPKLLLSCLIVKVQRNGNTETTFGDVVDELYRLIKTASAGLDKGLFTALAGGTKALNTDDAHMSDSLGLRRAAVELLGAGIILLEAQRAERPSKMRLAIGEEDIKMAFRDDDEIKALGLFF